MPPISHNDFTYYRKKLEKDKAHHEREFMERINPSLIDSYLEGFPSLKDKDRDYKNEEAALPERISMNYLFTTTSTLVPQLYPENIYFIGIPRREGMDELNAKVAASSMNYYWTQMLADRENKKAVMSAWLYGIAFTKQGWRTVFKKNAPAKKTMAEKIGGTLKRFGKPSIEEKENFEYIDNEGPFMEFLNPKNVYLDSERPYGYGKYIHQRIPQTLYEIETNGLYTVPQEFIQKFKRGRDTREVEIETYESYIWVKGELYLLVSADGWEEPLRWDKLPYASEGFPIKSLTLSEQVNNIYPLPNAKIAQRLQRLADYILTLQKKHVERYRDLTLLAEDAFDADDRARIKKGDIGLIEIVKGSVPPANAAVRYQSSPIPESLYNLQAIIQENIKEVLSVVGARSSGSSENETATQEKISEFGNELRTAGMQDDIKEFVRSQGKKLLADLKQFATAPAIFEVTGLDLRDDNGNLVTEKWVEFATERDPRVLREIIPKEMDIDIDVSTMLERSLPMERRQLQEFVQGVILPLIPILQAEGKRFNATRFITKMAEKFEGIDSAEQFFDDAGPVDPLAAVPGQPGVTPVPTDVDALEPQVPGV